jgi:hypothetical protein
MVVCLEGYDCDLTTVGGKLDIDGLIPARDKLIGGLDCELPRRPGRKHLDHRA